MATVQQKKQDVMAKINSVIAAVDLYPEIDTTNTQLSFNPSANPIDLLVDFFKSTKGYDWLINAVSRYISHELPALELAVKGILLSNIETILSCSIKPIITEQMINDGVVFDLNKIDLLNIFDFSPLDQSVDNPGRYYYFGCTPEDGVDIIDDVKNSRDLNAVLWYAKNTAGERVVWRRESDVGKPYNINKVGVQPQLTWLKQVKSNGIATIEFNGRSSGLTDSEGNGYSVQEPIDNCIHVFIGYCAPEKTESHTSQIAEQTRKIAQYDKLLEDVNKYSDLIKEWQKKARTEAIEQGETIETLNTIDVSVATDLDLLNVVKYAIDGINIQTHETGKNMCNILQAPDIELNSIHESFTITEDLYNSNVVTERNIKLQLMEQEAGLTADYPTAKSNYYYLHPLLEWNTDFVMSVKLFDEKVVAAQLIDALTNCLSFSLGINFSAQMKFVQAQLREIVQKIIESDDGTISDCFFSFTNDSYNDLLKEVELNRTNLNTTNGGDINEIPSAADVMESLNTLSPDASKEELQSAISSSLFVATSSANPHDYGYIEGKVLLGLNHNMSIIDQLLTKLVYVIVMAIIQPKIYILLMMNLKLLGSEPNFDLSKFMQQFSNLLSELIKKIRDNILEYFKNQLLLVLGELVKTLAIKLSLEQYQYYIDLIKHCIDCLRIHRNEYDWLQDDVNYADITEIIEQINEEC